MVFLSVMIFFSILIFILAMSLRSFQTQITPIFFTRIASLAFIYAGVLTFNALYIQSIGSGIGIYSGLFQVTYYSMLFETFLYVTGAIILLSWPLYYKIASVYPFNRNILNPFLNKLVNSSVIENSNKNILTEDRKEGSLPFNKFISLDASPYVELSASRCASSNTMKENSLEIKEDFNLLNTNYQKINRAKTAGALGLITSLTTSAEAREYSLIALFSSLGGSLLLSSSDMLSMYLSIELQSFGLYILATIYRESGSATSAGLKYFLLGGLSSCLILLGLALVYSFTGLTSFESLYSLVSVLSISDNTALVLNNLVTEIDPLIPGSSGNTSEMLSLIDSSERISQGLSLGLIFIVVGFLFKIAGAPFHNWAPDVYDESPTNITIWLTIMPKLSIILLLLELEMGISLNLFQPLVAESSGIGSIFLAGGAETNIFDSYLQLNIINGASQDGTHNVLKNIFLLSSLLSLIIGTVVGLAQIRIKRLLAYSTVSHIGFLLLALAISTEQSTESLIFYLIQYTITNLNAFFILLAFGYIINSLISTTYINTEIKFIFNLKGQFLSNPILSLSLAVCLFSMAGIPPLIGFFGKQSVLFSAIGNGYYFMALVAIIVSVISASYYLRIIRELYSENGNKTSDKDSIKSLGSAGNNDKSKFSFSPSSQGALNAPLFSIDTFLAVFNTSANDSSISNPNNKKIKILEDIEKHLTIKNENVLSYGTESYRSLNIGGGRAGSTPFLQKEVGGGASPNLNIFVSSANNTYLNLTNTHSFIIASLTLSIIFYVLKPSILLNSAVLSTLSLFYF
jgi:NADH-ubiquinone oxidoreductase chain 2